MAGAAPSRPSPTRTWCWAGSRPTCSAASCRSTPAAARAGLAALAAKLGLDVERRRAGILEISAWNQANALRQITVKRGLDVRDFTLATFGGSGSLLACRLIDILGLPAVVVPPNPGNLSAFGLLTVDVRNDYVQTAVARHAQLDRDRGRRRSVAELHAPRPTTALAREGFAARRAARSSARADLRYFGQAFEVRVAVPDGAVRRRLGRGGGRRVPRRAPQRCTATTSATDPRQQVEWVNLRVTGIGPIRTPDAASRPRPAAGAPAPTGHRGVCFDEPAARGRRSTTGADLGAGTWSPVRR